MPAITCHQGRLAVIRRPKIKNKNSKTASKRKEFYVKESPVSANCRNDIQIRWRHVIRFGRHKADLGVQVEYEHTI